MTLLREALENDILASIRKPSRYLGNEFNAVHKNPADVDLRVALAFPDLYELGLGNLGLQILYEILNNLPWCWAERAYAPAADMDAALRARQLPLFTHESKTPLDAMDLLGFTLQSELTYTNVLSMLDLAGLPLRTHQRAENAPITIAGGPGAFNPAPMAPFIDAFVIGDGEEAVVDIVNAIRPLRRAPRNERLAALAAIPGVYVPALHSGNAQSIQARRISRLDDAAYPVHPIVPFGQLVHDRVPLEVFRGCTHGCRFCHAGMIHRPVRERSLGEIDRLMTESLANTGYEEVSLVSLSTCDYSAIHALIRQSAQRAAATRTAVSLPSLRVDPAAVELADAIAGMRRSGLTFAPEAGTPRLRAVINKAVTDEQLFAAAEAAFRLGWGHVKCYFMIGLPTETDADVEAIATLCHELLNRGRAITRRAEITMGVSTFVPKPFTPFQWAGQISLEETCRRQQIIEHALNRRRGIKFGRHEAASTWIEGLIARGGPETADLIEAAYRHGARFETDSASLNRGAWEAAIAETGYSAEHAFSARPLDASLPWDLIDAHIDPAWLRAEYARAHEAQFTPDCRQGCRACGARNSDPGPCAIMLESTRTAASAEPLQASATTTGANTESEPPETVPVQRLQFRIGRDGEARFLSHLEWAAAWMRALRRVNAPLAYSQGFHAHAKVALSAALPVGESSEAEYLDILLIQRVEPQALLDALSQTLPLGFHVYSVQESPLNAPSLMSIVHGYTYRIETSTDPGQLRARIEEILTAPTLTVERAGRPDGPRRRDTLNTLDLRPSLAALECRQHDPATDRITLRFTTLAEEGKRLKSREIIALLGLDPATTRICKTETHFIQSQ